MTKMGEPAPATTSTITADEAALYDRQIRLWGLEAQNRLKNASVLLVGMSGVGAEIAKNLMLAGLKCLALVDDQVVSEIDLKTNCLLTRTTALHKDRAEAVSARCQQLNPLVLLKTMNIPTKAVVAKVKELIESELFDLVCCVDRSIDECVEINNVCRSCRKLTLFSMGSVFGYFGFTFNDFGENFEYACEVLAPLPGKREECDVSDDDVVWDEAEPEFKKPKLVPGGGGDTVSKATSSKSSGIEPKEGSETSKKEREKTIVRKVTSFCSFDHLLKSPSNTEAGPREGKRRRPKAPYPVGYYLFQVTAGFHYQYKRTPQYSTKSHDIRALNIEFNSVTAQLGDVKLDLPENFAESLFSQVPAVCAIVGGQLGQEIIKAVSRKDEPINNMFFYNPFDSSGMLAKIPRT